MTQAHKTDTLTLADYDSILATITGLTDRQLAWLADAPKDDREFEAWLAAHRAEIVRRRGR